jgi:hypothetical protein
MKKYWVTKIIYIYNMKKLFLPIAFVVLLSSCAIFQKKEKYGCPGDATGKSQEQIRDAAAKKKYKGGKKF